MKKIPLLFLVFFVGAIALANDKLVVSDHEVEPMLMCPVSGQSTYKITKKNGKTYYKGEKNENERAG